MASTVQKEEMVDALRREATFSLGQGFRLASELPCSQQGERKT